MPQSAAADEAQHGILTAGAWISPHTWTTGSPAEFMANILLFVPVGALLRLTLPRGRGITNLALAALVTTAIELAQIPLERVSDPRDLLANSVGALLGIVVASSLLAPSGQSGPVRRSIAPRPSQP